MKGVLNLNAVNMSEVRYENGTKLFGNQTQMVKVDESYNGTGFYIEEDEIGFNEVETIFIALFATLIPLLVILTTIYGIWLMYKKYKFRKDVRYGGMLHREGTSESISRPLHSHLLQEKTCVDGTHLSINTEEVEVCDGTTQSQMRNNHSNTNGSIITMTLRNNHLIVETEERNDIEEDNKETKMKYSPSTREGVFVVEVQQGVRRSPTTANASVPYAEPEISISSDQCALVHNPPEKYSNEDTLDEPEDSEYYIETISPDKSAGASEKLNCKTGLASSDNSLHSQHSYCYTNQQCYDSGCYGYNIYVGYYNDGPLKRLQDDTRPKITAAVYKKQFRSLGESCGSTFSLNEVRSDQDEDIPEETQLELGTIIKKVKNYENKAFDSTESRT